MKAPRPLQSPMREDARDVRPQRAVDLDVAALVGLDARLSRPRSSVFGRRPVATRRCEPVTSIVLPPTSSATAIPPLRLSTRVASASVRIRMPSSSRISRIACGDVLVLARDQPLVALDDGHLAAEAPVHLAELEADVAAAEDHQMLGQEVDRHHRGVVEIGHGIDAGDRRDIGATADVDEDLVGREHARRRPSPPSARRSGRGRRRR